MAANLLIVNGRIWKESEKGLVSTFETLFTDSDLTAPAIPTVNSLTTEDTTPVVTGTWDSTDIGVVLAVNVDGTTYTLGTDPELTNVGDDWSLAILVPLALGTYDVAATATDVALNVSNDTTTDELVVHDITPPPVPTVDSQTATTATPTITGTYGSSESSELEVVVNGNLYALTSSPELTAIVDVWSLAIPASAPLPSGTFTVSAVATDLSGNQAASASLSQLTIDLVACTQTCKTFRKLLNRVLENLSEESIPDAQTSLTDTYHILLRNIVNDVLGEVFSAHNWGSILKTVTAEVTAGNKTGTLRFGDDCAEADARLAYLPVPHYEGGQFLPLAYDVTDSTNPQRLFERNLHWVLHQQVLETTTNQQPIDFCLDPNGASIAVRLTPVPSTTRSLQFEMYVPQDEFNADSGDFDTCVKLPRTAIRAVEMGATWQAMEEKGEELGPNSRFSEKKFRIALDSAIVSDDTLGTGDNNELVVT